MTSKEIYNKFPSAVIFRLCLFKDQVFENYKLIAGGRKVACQDDGQVRLYRIVHSGQYVAYGVPEN